MTVTQSEYKAIYAQDEEIGPALIPLLDKFAHLDPVAYGNVAKALLDAYQVGHKNGYRSAREVALSVFKGKTTEELMRNKGKANG